MQSIEVVYRNHPLNIKPNLTEYTPTSLITELNETLTGKETFETNISGICMGKKDKVFYDFCFGKLIDLNYDFGITLKIPASLNKEIVNGKAYTLGGHIEKQISSNNDGSIKFVFRVNRIIDKQDSDFIEEQNRIRKEIISRKHKKISLKNKLIPLLNSEVKPKILIISGKSAIVHRDVIESLESHSHSYYIVDSRVNMKDPNEISKTIIINKDKFDVIALIRGGGELEALSDAKILEAVLSLKDCCFVSAIGHFENIGYLDEISDESFGTPTKFGNELKDIAEGKEDIIKYVKVKAKVLCILESIVIISLILVIIYLLVK